MKISKGIEKIKASIESKIHLKIFLSFLVVALIPLIIVNIYINSIYSKRLKEELVKKNRLVEESIVSEFEDYLIELEYLSNLFFNSNIQSILREKGDTVAIYQNQAIIEKMLTVNMDLFGIMDKIDHIAFVKEDKSIYNVSSLKYRDEMLLFHLTDNVEVNNYKNHILLPLEEVPQLEIQNSNNADKYVYIRRINDMQGVIGDLYIVFDRTELDAFFHDILAISNTEVIVRDIAGRLLYSSGNGEDIHEMPYAKEGYFVENLKLNVSFIERSNYIQENIRQLSIITFGLIILSIMIILLVSQLFARHLIQPITLLHNKILGVKHGHFDTRIDVVSKDELGDLCQAFNEMAREIDRLINQNYCIKLKEHEAIIAALQTQINPHFLYNTLDMIKSMSDIYGAYEVADVILALSKNFRYVTHTSSYIVTIQEELDNLENYMKIVNARFGGKIAFDVHISDELRNCPIVKVCLQPIVENAIAHGIGKSGNKGNIQLNFKIIEDTMHIMILDNGSGIKKDRLNEINERLNNNLEENISTTTSSVGLKNIHDRIRLHYGQEYGLVITSRENEGTEVLVKYPIVERNE